VCLHGIQRRNILLGVLAVVVISHGLIFQSPLGTWALRLITVQLIFAEAKRVAIELARVINWECIQFLCRVIIVNVSPRSAL
jgi:hypothetical protein